MTLVTIPEDFPGSAALSGSSPAARPLPDAVPARDMQAEARARFREARRAADFTAARTRALTALAEAGATLADDPDFDSYETRFAAEAGRIREAIAGGLREPAVRSAFLEAYAPLVDRALAGVGKLARENQIRFASEQLHADLGALAGLAAGGPLGLDREEIVGLGEEAISLAHDAGLIAADDAELQRASFHNAVDSARARSRLESGPELLLAELDDPAAYPSLADTDRDALRRHALAVAAPPDAAVPPAVHSLSRILAAAGRDGMARARAGTLDLDGVRQFNADLNQVAEALVAPAADEAPAPEAPRPKVLSDFLVPMSGGRRCHGNRRRRNLPLPICRFTCAATWPCMSLSARATASSGAF